MKASVTLRNAWLDAIETTIGTSPKLEIRTGSAPANAAAADSGTLLVEMTLPSDWLAAASSGAKELAGSWSGVAVATGAPGHWRIKDSAGSTTHLQGSCTANDGGGEIDIDISGGGTDITSGGTVSISAMTFSALNS